MFFVFYHYHHIIYIFFNYTTINSDLKVKDLQSLWFLGFHAEIMSVDSFWEKNVAISSYQDWEQSRWTKANKGKIYLLRIDVGISKREHSQNNRYNITLRSSIWKRVVNFLQFVRSKETADFIV